MRARGAELGKTVLIWALLLSLLWLTGLTWVYDDSLLDAPALAWVSGVGRLLGVSGAAPNPITPPDGGRVAREAARPVRVAVMQGGARLGAQYAPEVVDALYERLKNTVGEAIGSAVPPRRQTRAEWERALSYDSVYWEYAAAVPLSVLAEWLSVAPPAGFDAPVRRFFLSNRGGTLALFFLNEDTLVPYVSDTALSFGPVDTSGLSPCRFAFEAEDAALTRAPDTLLFDMPPALTAVRCETPALAGAEVEAFLRGLRVNPDTLARYTEPDGTDVYVDDPRVCRFSPDGVIRYRANGAADGVPATATPAGRIEAARALLETLSPLLGDARFSLTGYAQTEEDRFAVDFDYETQGAAVLPEAENPAARVVLNGGVIAEVTVRVRRFTRADERIDLMPETLAYRLIEARFPSRTFALTVCFAGGEDLQTPVWFGK
ncbi:MAG: hypothetical protein LBH86_03230 [Oscillospiraceae bacterium]|jgi:hypothetical protein|nr:hypothetical protein [Oscillospiraceae bacterium]